MQRAVALAVNLIWLKYDEDKSGDLDYDEALGFIKEVMNTMNPDLIIQEEIFREFFNKHDVDGGGSLDKDEMTEMIMTLL